MWKTDEAVLAIHAVDFGVGFCSKLLPGAIYNLFFDSVSIAKTSLYLSALLVLFFIILSFILEKFVLNVEAQYRKTAFITLAFFLTGPSTFAIHVYYPGMLDMYWVFCALLFFVLLSKKQLTPLIFLPFVLCITVYFASLICFIPFFVIIVLYKISCTESKKEKAVLWSVLVFSAIAAVGLSLYFAVFEGNNLIYSMEEFHKIYSARGVDNFFYFDQSLYKDITNNNLDEFTVYTPTKDSVILEILAEILLRINYNFSKITLIEKLVIFAVILPIAGFIYTFLISQLKLNIKEKNRIKAFVNVCIIALPFVTIPLSTFFSEDLVRWIAHSFLTLFASFIYIVHKEGTETLKWIEERISKIPFSIMLIYLTFYASTVYHPYYIG